MIVKRGEIFYADLNPVYSSELGGVRPVIIIQNDVGNKYGSNVIVACITSNINVLKLSRLPTHVQISSEKYGLKKESVIMLDQIKTLDKRKLKTKIGTICDDDLDKVNLALNVSLGINKESFKKSIELENYIKELQLYIKNLNKPLVITEGKTDSKLIQVAWSKLYPEKELFFECKPSGIEAEENKREGNADTVRRTIEYLSNIEERTIIGLFDNDRAGNEQFKGLNKKIFEKYHIENDIRKHINKNIFGMLLPVPDNRKIFVTKDDITQRYFCIEHYFTDDVLKKHSMYGSNILGTCVFKVNNRKDQFSNEVESLDSKDFIHFKILFSKLEKLLNTK